MDFKSYLKESKLFDAPDELKIDVDQDGPYDLAHALLPVLVKMAYVNLHALKRQHEKKHGPRSDEPDAFNFSFTHSALEEEVHVLIDDLREKLNESSSTDVRSAIASVAKSFKDPILE